MKSPAVIVNVKSSPESWSLIVTREPKPTLS